MIIYSYYNAPEVLLSTETLTFACDVWSFAMTWLRLLGVTIPGVSV